MLVPIGAASFTSETGLVDHEQFVRQMTGLQDRLFAYILTLLPNADQAADVLQEANVVMWRKMNELEAGQSFEAWACRVAFYEVLSFRRNQHRDRHIFDDALIQRISDESSTRHTGESTMSHALEHCLGELPERDRELIRERYQDESSIAAIAESSGKTPGAVSTALHRVRRWLLKCIRRQLGQEENL